MVDGGLGRGPDVPERVHPDAGVKAKVLDLLRQPLQAVGELLVGVGVAGGELSLPAPVQVDVVHREAVPVLGEEPGVVHHDLLADGLAVVVPGVEAGGVGFGHDRVVDAAHEACPVLEPSEDIIHPVYRDPLGGHRLAGLHHQVLVDVVVEVEGQRPPIVPVVGEVEDPLEALHAQAAGMDAWVNAVVRPVKRGRHRATNQAHRSFDQVV